MGWRQAVGDSMREPRGFERGTSHVRRFECRGQVETVIVDRLKQLVICRYRFWVDEVARFIPAGAFELDAVRSA